MLKVATSQKKQLVASYVEKKPLPARSEKRTSKVFAIGELRNNDDDDDDNVINNSKGLLLIVARKL